MHRPKLVAQNWFEWLDSDSASEDERALRPGLPQSEVDRWIPFIFLHAGCLGVIWTGTSATALMVCVGLYFFRMFIVTGWYHRYFSHRAFKTSRTLQFVFALLGTASMQRGPLWWAAHHRQHHAQSDTEYDVHSPTVRGFIWSHMGWITSSKNMLTDYQKVRDFEEYPELRWVNRFDWVMPTMMIAVLYGAGELLWEMHPELQTSGAQLVVWGFFISTTILFHATSSINSIAHLFGYRRYETDDNSRNNPLLALFTLGEGWHNNHHKYSFCVRQGFAWWEIDVAYQILKLFEWAGLVWDLKQMPKGALELSTARDAETAPDSESVKAR